MKKSIKNPFKSIKNSFVSMSTFGKVVTIIGIIGLIACLFSFRCERMREIPSSFGGWVGSFFVSALFTGITLIKIDELDKKFRNGIISKIASVFDLTCSGNLDELNKESNNKNLIAKEFADVFPECKDCVIRYYEKFKELDRENFSNGEPAPSFRDVKHLKVVTWNTFRSFDTLIGDEYFDAEKFRSLRKKFEEDFTTALRRDLFVN